MDFLDKTHCDRCGVRLQVRILSMFNTDTICMECKRKEQAHPSYERARRAEEEAVMRGDRHFRGIGLPPDLRRR